MNIHVVYDPKLEQIQMGISLEELASLKNYKTVLLSLQAYAAMVELDPELSLEDLEEIAEKTQELGKDRFTFIIGPEEIEVDI